MDRLFLKNKVMLLSLFMFNCCFAILATTIIQKLELYYSDKGIYSWKTVEINVQSEKECLDFPNCATMADDYYIIKHIYGSSVDIKGVLLSDTKKFHLSKGRFLSKSDCENNVRKAVIGNNLKKNLYKIGNKSFISIENQEYEVTGILNEQQNIGLENTILIPLQTALEIYGINGQYSVDGSIENINKISLSFEHAGETKIATSKLEITASLSDFRKNSNEILHIYLFLFISLIVFLIFSIDYCTLKLPQEYNIYLTLGFSNKILFLIFSKTYIKLIAICNAVSIMISEIVLKIFAGVHVHVLGILTAFGLNILIVFIIITGKIIKEKRGVWQ